MGTWPTCKQCVHCYKTGALQCCSTAPHKSPAVWLDAEGSWACLWELGSGMQNWEELFKFLMAEIAQCYILWPLTTNLKPHFLVLTSSPPLALALSFLLSSLFRTTRNSQNGDGCNLRGIFGCVEPDVLLRAGLTWKLDQIALGHAWLDRVQPSEEGMFLNWENVQVFFLGWNCMSFEGSKQAHALASSRQS